MTEFPPVPLPVLHHAAGRAATVAQIDAWLSAPPLRALVEAFGRPFPAGRNVAQDLDEFAATTWDFRQGRERDLAAEVDFPEHVHEVVARAAPALGLVGGTPPTRQSYDAVLVLGGLVRACVVRPRYAARLISEAVRPGDVVALGAFRPLSDIEHGVAERLGLTAHDEIGVMTEGMRAAFRPWLIEPPKVAGGEVPGDAKASWQAVTWSVTEEALRQGLRSASVVAAPTSRPDALRANTVETYDFWATELRRPSVRSVLVVTNAVYVPYQGMVAIESLGLRHRLDVETVGVPPEVADLGPDTQTFGTQQYLQEIRSAIGAMRRLRMALTSESPAS